MLYVHIVNGKAIGTSDEYPGNDRHAGNWQCRVDWSTFERVEQVADELNAAIGGSQDSGKYIAIDSGEHVSPRYDVIVRPMVGDKVSYSFNGDTYPDGTITKITGQNFRIITTSTGSVYYRRKLSGCWKKKGGTWNLVLGHRNERNPSF